MAADLPTANAITRPEATNAQQKLNFAALRNFMANLLGTDSADKVAARAALGLDNIVGNAGAVSGRRRNINGDFSVNQLGLTSPVTLAAGAYGHDGWKAGAAGCTYSFATSAGLTTVTITAGSLVQVLDGRYFKSGTHVLSWSGTAQGKIAGGAYSASGVTATLTGGTNSSVEFNTGTLTLVQAEPGTAPTPYEHRQEELWRCYEYFQPFGGVVGLAVMTPLISGGGGSRALLVHRRPMAFPPTLSTTAGGFTGSDNSLGPVSLNAFVLDSASINESVIAFSHGTLTGNAARIYQCAATSSFLYLSARI